MSSNRTSPLIVAGSTDTGSSGSATSTGRSRYSKMRANSASELTTETLVADIRKNGQREPIVLYQGKILDGRNRYNACLVAGVGLKISKHEDDCPFIGDPAAYVISKNIHRRHLTAEQRRDLIARLLKAAPEKSDRQIAETVKNKIGI